MKPSAHVLLVLVLLTCLFSSYGQSTTFPSSWSSRKEIQKQWIMLQRDSSGYLIYEPCNGSTPRIYFDYNSLTIFWQLDAPTKLCIDKFTRMVGNKSFNISAYDKTVNLDIYVEIKDAKRKLCLWTFGGNKWVMTPVECKEEFRLLINPCPTEMKPEKVFLPLEF